MLLLCVGQLTSNQELAPRQLSKTRPPITVRHISKQARAVSDNPRNEILVLVDHGARSNTNDLQQEMELARAAEYVEG